MTYKVSLPRMSALGYVMLKNDNDKNSKKQINALKFYELSANIRTTCN